MVMIKQSADGGNNAKWQTDNDNVYNSTRQVGKLLKGLSIAE